jgi:hypothetical protein
MSKALVSNHESGLTLTFVSLVDSGEDAFWVGGPDEVFGIDVCLPDEAVDGRPAEINDRSEHAALEALARELGEEAFERVSQARRKSRRVPIPAVENIDRMTTSLSMLMFPASLISLMK